MARVLFFLQLIVALVVLPLWPGLDPAYAVWGLISLGSFVVVSAGAVVAVFGPRASGRALADAWSHEKLGPWGQTSVAVWKLLSQSFPVAGALGALMGLIGPLTAWNPERNALAGTLILLFFALVWGFLGLLISRILHDVVVRLASLALPATAIALSEAVARRFGLTPRETDAARCVLDGLTYADAAKALGISPSTAKTHILSVYTKTGTGNKVELLRLVEAETARLHQSADGGAALSGRE